MKGLALWPTDAPCAPSVGPTPDLRLRAVGDIDHVDPGEWNSFLEPRDLQASHRFVRLCQQARIEGATLAQLLVYDDDGLAGIACLARMRVRLDLLSTGGVRRLLGRCRRWAPGTLQLPFAMCGLPVSFGDSGLRLREDADAESIVHRVAGELERRARADGARFVCFKEFEPGRERGLRALGERGYVRLPSLPAYDLQIEWSCFADYVSAMRAGYRRQVLQTLARAHASGLETHLVEDLRGECGRLHALYDQVMDRAEFQLERLGASFFEQLAGFGREARAIVALWRGRPVAAAILVRAADVETFLLAGIDYARNRECLAYPRIVLATVEHAIQTRARVLRMGQTSDALKSRLGARAVPRVLYLRPLDPAWQRAFRAACSTLFPERRAVERRVFRA